MSGGRTLDSILIIGCGDVGLRAARLAREKGAAVTVLVRSEESRRRLKAEGFIALVGDLDTPSSLSGLPTRGTVIVYFIPPPGEGAGDSRMNAFCASVAPGEEPSKIVYVSTSGVYGDCGGARVTERTPVNPRTDRARRRLAAEDHLREWGARRGVAIVVLRVSGIYGPGRLPLERIRAGQPVLAEAEAPWSNRIHVDDLARVCIAAGEKGESGDIFNISDGRPGTMTGYFNAVADVCGLPRPPQVSLAEARRVMNPLMLSYLGESRRMDNTRMVEKLGFELLYPDLEAGIRASLEENRQPD
jgi:nucleoside-diphosphate-sugar epimerase